jgi:hypothetical protein
MANSEIQIYPTEDNQWSWRKVEDGEKTEQGDAYDDRSTAIEQGRASRGEEGVSIVKDGETIGQGSIGGQGRVVLLRKDGSEYAELDPPASVNQDPNEVHRITIGAVEEGSEAQDIEGEEK